MNVHFGTYFPEANELQHLYERAESSQKPTMVTLIRDLNITAASAQFDPVSTALQKSTPDKFFQDNSNFSQLEDQLVEKITPANVVDAFRLIVDAHIYWPTQKVIQALKEALQTYK